MAGQMDDLEMSQPDSSTESDETATANALLQLAIRSTAEKFSKKARECATEVLKGWRVLDDILSCQEKVIRKRWSKKGKVWREKILSNSWSSWGEIPLHHRPDLRILDQEDKTGVFESAKPPDRDSKGPFMWPYINLEDLSLEKPLLLLLHARGKYSPEKFVDSDLRSCLLGFDSGALDRGPGEGITHVMYLNGDDTTTYGVLVPLAVAAMYNQITNVRAGFKPQIGLLILEIQQRLMRFLINCCENILDDAAYYLITQHSFLEEHPPPEKGEVWQSMEIHARHAPYRLPLDYDLRAVLKLLYRQYYLARDHLVFLREDPGYFAEIVHEHSEHKQGLILDAMGKVSPTHGRGRFWDRVVEEVIRYAYIAFFSWQVIVEQASCVEKCRVKYEKFIEEAFVLPEEYMREIQILRNILTHFSIIARFNLRRTICSSPPLRPHFLRHEISPGSTSRTGGGGEKEVLVEFVAPEQANIGHDNLLWLIDKFWEQKNWLRYGSQNLIDEMERLAVGQPDQFARLSPKVAREFAELGLLVLADHELNNNYMPWAAEFKEAYKLFRTEVEEHFIPPRLQLIALVGEKIRNLSLSQFCYPLDEKLFYPVDKRRSKSNVESMRTAEQNLDFLWQGVEKACTSSRICDVPIPFDGSFFPDLKIHRTPEWCDLAEDTGKCPENEPPAEAYAQSTSPKFSERNKASKASPENAPEDCSEDEQPTEACPRGTPSRCLNGDELKKTSSGKGRKSSSENEKPSEVTPPSNLSWAAVAKNAIGPVIPPVSQKLKANDTQAQATPENIFEKGQSSVAQSTASPIDTSENSERHNTTVIKQSWASISVAGLDKTTNKTIDMRYKPKRKPKRVEHFEGGVAMTRSSGEWLKDPSTDDISEPKLPKAQNHAATQRDTPTSADIHDNGGAQSSEESKVTEDFNNYEDTHLKDDAQNSRNAQVHEPLNDNSEPSNHEDIKLTSINYTIDNRAFRVFKALFYTPCELDAPKEIAWEDFLHAMNNAGLVPFKLYGSLWYFNNSHDLPIAFHQPGPNSKIPLRVAMRMGRQLHRAYGWELESFFLDNDQQENGDVMRREKDEHGHAIAKAKKGKKGKKGKGKRTSSDQDRGSSGAIGTEVGTMT